jgi:TonB family protein
VRGVGVATGEAGMLRSLRGGGAGGGGTVQGLGALASAGGNANVASGGMAEREVRGRAAAERAEAVGGSGELDDAEVRRVINQRMTAVRMCYERQLRRNRQLQGRLNIQLTIGMSGSVSSASAVQNTIGDPDVAACVVSVLRNAHFAAPSGGAVTISVPFVFTPSQ